MTSPHIRHVQLSSILWWKARLVQRSRCFWSKASSQVFLLYFGSLEILYICFDSQNHVEMFSRFLSSSLSFCDWVDVRQFSFTPWNSLGNWRLWDESCFHFFILCDNGSHCVKKNVIALLHLDGTPRYLLRYFSWDVSASCKLFFEHLLLQIAEPYLYIGSTYVSKILFTISNGRFFSDSLLNNNPILALAFLLSIFWWSENASWGLNLSLR